MAAQLNGPAAATPTPAATATIARVGTPVRTSYGSYTNLEPKELKAMLAKAEKLDGLREELRIEKVTDFLLAEAVTAG